MFSSLFSLTKIPHVSTVLEMADLISLANRRCGNSVSVSLNLIFFFGEFFFFFMGRLLYICLLYENFDVLRQCSMAFWAKIIKKIKWIIQSTKPNQLEFD